MPAFLWQQLTFKIVRRVVIPDDTFAALSCIRGSPMKPPDLIGA
jgi:hypothetical protein